MGPAAAPGVRSERRKRRVCTAGPPGSLRLPLAGYLWRAGRTLAAATLWSSSGPAPAAASLWQPGASAARGPLRDFPRRQGRGGDGRGPEGRSPRTYLVGRAPFLGHSGQELAAEWTRVCPLHPHLSTVETGCTGRLARHGCCCLNSVPKPPWGRTPIRGSRRLWNFGI